MKFKIREAPAGRSDTKFGWKKKKNCLRMKDSILPYTTSITASHAKTDGQDGIVDADLLTEQVSGNVDELTS